MISTYNILLVEDDEVDVMSIERAFAKANILNPLIKACNGQEALKILKNEISHPVIILLDINMPIMNGLEFLEALREDEQLNTIPVVMLTSSKNEEDMLEAYQNHVAGYLTKPLGMEQLIEKMATLGKYWALCEMLK